MKNKIKHSTTEKSAGEKQGSREKSQQSYIIYNNCYDCPLRVYIELVCNNNLDALVVSGEPTNDTLIDAREKILDEYHNLLGESSASMQNTFLREVYMYRSQIVGMSVCLDLIGLGNLDSAISALNKLGIKCNVSDDEVYLSELIKKVDGKISEKKIRLAKAQKGYELIMSKNKGEPLKPSHLIDQLAALSRWLGFRLSTDVTLAEFATYIKQMKEYAQQLKMKNNG